MHAAPSDAELDHLVERYRSCELLTVGRDGTPIAWPTIAVREPGGTLLISTSIAFPQKALNIARDPRVAVLFSDPTASGLDDPPELLVQGRAEVSELETSVAAHPELWRRILTVQPSGRLYSAIGPSRRLMDVYYMRLYLTVTPEVVRSRAIARGSSPLPGAPAGASALLSGLGAEWRHYPDAVVAAFDTTGRPTLARIRPRIDAQGVTVDATGLAAGPASILTHRHDRTLAATRSHLAVGALGDDGRFTPTRSVAGVRPVNPFTLPGLIRGMRATAQRYLDRRDLPRPAIDWAAVATLKRTLPDPAALPAPRRG